MALDDGRRARRRSARRRTRDTAQDAPRTNRGITMTDLPSFTAADVESQPTIDLPAFENDDAVDLGLTAVEVIREQNLSLAVRILLRGDVVFQAKLKETGAGNDPWLAGKAAVVEQFGEP